MDSVEIYASYYMEEDMPNIIYAPFRADYLYLPISMVVVDESRSMRVPSTLLEGTVYTARSRIPKVDAKSLTRVLVPLSPNPGEPSETVSRANITPLRRAASTVK